MHTPAALRRLHTRRRNPATWRTVDVQQLEDAYWACPKLWWHVRAVVFEQVQVVLEARARHLLPLLTPPLLDDLAETHQRDTVAGALRALLRVLPRGAALPPWTSLRDAAVTLLRAEAGAFDRPGPIPARLILAEWATPLVSRDALLARGRAHDTCLGQRSWWRDTLAGSGLAFAIDWQGEVATAWIVPEPEAGATLEMITGPRNAAVSGACRGAVEDALAAALQAQPDPFGIQKRIAQDDLTPTDLCQARHDLLTAVGLGRLSPPAVRHQSRPLSRLPGLPAVHWSRTYGGFIWQARFLQDTTLIDATGDTPTASVAWDPGTGGLTYDTPAGAVTLLPTAPPTVLGDAALTGPAALWLSVDPGGLQAEDEPDDVVTAMARFATFLPPAVVRAARQLSALDHMPALWMLCVRPDLGDALLDAPPLTDAVVERVEEDPGSLDALPRLDGAEAPSLPAWALLSWLGCDRPRDVARRLPRMRGHWSRDNFRLLGRLLGHPDAANLLEGRHELRAAQVLVLGAALGAGLLDRVTPTLLHDVTAHFGGRWHRGCLDAAFAQLACHALTHPIPKLRSAAHLARLLVQADTPRPAWGARVRHLPGPWGTPVVQPHDLEALAAEAGLEPRRWLDASFQGQICCFGHPAGVPAVTWLEPAGRQGALDLIAVSTPTGAPAPEAALRAVREGLDAYHEALDALPPGWGPQEALAAGLSADAVHISQAGRLPLASLVGAVLDLCR